MSNKGIGPLLLPEQYSGVGLSASGLAKMQSSKPSTKRVLHHETLPTPLCTSNYHAAKLWLAAMIWHERLHIFV